MNFKVISVMLILLFFGSFLFAQNKVEAEDLVREGIVLHDNGDFGSSLSKYDKALKLDKDNLFALIEKGVTLLAMHKYEETIKYSQKAITTYPDDEGLSVVYVTYGNAADGLKQSDRAIEIYDEGLAKFPQFYQLHYNKGVSLSNTGRLEEALSSFKKAILLNPNHAGSHYAIARISAFNNQRMCALLAFWRCLSLEPEGSRAKENLENSITLMNANVKQASRDSIIVYHMPETNVDALKNKKPTADNFELTDLMVSLEAARDYDPQFKHETEVQKYKRKLESVCLSLISTKGDNYGFFWEYYAPYFMEMQEKKFVEAFTHFAFIASGDDEAINWINANNAQLESFLNWSVSFEWKAE